MRHVILGNGAAGLSAARTLRALRPADEITMLSEEAYPTYTRCLLADYAGGSVPRERLFLHPESYYREHGIELLLGERAVALDTEGHRLTLASGQTMRFDRLLLATGARAAAPPVPGIDGERILGLRTLDDAEGIRALACGARRAAVIGGGFAGLEVAYALRRRGLETTVLEMMPHVLSANLDETAATIIADDLAQAGVRLWCGAQHAATRIDAGAYGVRLTLRSEERLEVDLVVHAAGVRSNLSLVQGTAVRGEAGILVDDHLQTSVPGIYAAGDAAQARDLCTGQRRTSPIWPNAVAQGKLAAHNMAGVERIYTGEIGLQNAVEFREVPAIAFGLSKATEAEGYRVLSLHRPAEGTYRKMVLQGDVLRGMILVGQIANAGVLTRLIKRGTPLGPLADRTLDEGFSLAYLPVGDEATRAYAEEAQGYR